MIYLSTTYLSITPPATHTQDNISALLSADSFKTMEEGEEEEEENHVKEVELYSAIMKIVVLRRTRVLTLCFYLQG